jgi:hypothetical protein
VPRRGSRPWCWRRRTYAFQVELVVFLGVLLLALVAGTARASSEAGRRVNAIAFYVAWSVLALASASRARLFPASEIVIGVLVAALLWRIGSGLAAGRLAPSVRT